MQVYRGLDIITNKVTPEEQAQVLHHLLDFLDPLSRYSVTDFRNAALPIVERLLCEDKVPVIVGGTNYYIESLLWNVLVDTLPNKEGLFSSEKLVYDRDKETYMIKRNSTSGGDQNVQKKSKSSGALCDSDDCKESVNNNFIKSVEEKENNECGKEEGDKRSNNLKRKAEVKEVTEGKNGNEYACGKSNQCVVWQDTDMTTEELYCRLQEVDPCMAEQYHPNERRKIIR